MNLINRIKLLVILKNIGLEVIRFIIKFGFIWKVKIFFLLEEWGINYIRFLEIELNWLRECLLI